VNPWRDETIDAISALMIQLSLTTDALGNINLQHMTFGGDIPNLNHNRDLYSNVSQMATFSMFD
jgi:hypothetical protein